jgi:hypothetical protein
MKSLLLVFWFLFAATAEGVVIPDRTRLLLARKMVTSVSQVATMEIKVPTGGRKLVGGTGWWKDAYEGDYMKIKVVDKDGILGPANTTIMDFTDTGMVAGERGWYFDGFQNKLLEISAVADIEEVPAGVYLVVEAFKGAGYVGEDTFCANIKWGQ